MDDRNLDMPHGPQSIEQDAAPQHDAPTDHSVAAEGSRRAGMARTPPMVIDWTVFAKGFDGDVKLASRICAGLKVDTKPTYARFTMRYSTDQMSFGWSMFNGDVE